MRRIRRRSHRSRLSARGGHELQHAERNGSAQFSTFGTRLLESPASEQVTRFAELRSMAIDLNRVNPLTEAAIGATIKVHRALGPGLLESVYQACLVFELQRAGLQVRASVPLPVQYD